MKQARISGMARHAHAGRHDLQRGFTLVEMLVVIAIIGMIMGLIGPRVLNYLSESRVKAARIQIQSFSSALDLFYLDAGRYPSTAEGLAALVRPAGWHRPAQMRRRPARPTGAPRSKMVTRLPPASGTPARTAEAS